MARQGVPSPKYGHDGIYYWATGDAGPCPKGYIHIVQYDEQDDVVFELVHSKEPEGDGHVDFFGGNDRPSTGRHTLRLNVPSRNLSLDLFSCSFEDEYLHMTLHNYLSKFLADRLYAAYTGPVADRHHAGQQGRGNGGLTQV